MSLSRRSSFGSSPPQAADFTLDLKQRVITCLNKLSDRDTLALATAELESIARNLTHDSFAPFLACIHNTDASSKPPVRKQCVYLLTLLSNSHGDALAPFLSKMISTVLRRIRDADSAVRSACVDAVAAMSSKITKPPFSASFLKPLMDALALEQDSNSQIGSALCLAAAIDAAADPEPAQLRKTLARLGKLAKNDGFKAKAALLVLIGSIVGAGGASSRGTLDWLVPCVVEFLSSEDWAVRKGAAEALGRIASGERDLASLYTDSCLNALESRRFDKVKVVRETMNHTLELWKVLTGDSEEISAAVQPRSSIDNGIGRCFPPISRSSNDASFRTPQPKKPVPTNKSPPTDDSLVTTAKKRSPLSTNERNSDTAIPSKLDHKKPSDWKIEIAMPNSRSSKVAHKDDSFNSNSGDWESGENEHNGNVMPETKRVLFSRTHDEKVNKFGGLRSGFRVVPFPDFENYDSDVLVSNAAEEVYESPKDAEDLLRIREQLLQIENQQSSLLNLLQRFIGSSQNGLNSLETRVHGLEMALDEISYDLALSSGRIPNSESADQNTCCKLPGAEFLSSKFWHRAEGRCSTPRFSSSGTIPSNNVVPNKPDTDASAESCMFGRQRFQHQSRGAFIVNPVAEIHGYSRMHTGRYPDKTPKSTVQDAERVQVCNASGFEGVSPVTCIASRNQSRRSSA